MIGAITLNGDSWWWVSLLVSIALLGSSYFAWKSEGRLIKGYALGLSLRALGIVLLLLCLLDPHWTGERPAKGANIVAVVADNSQGMQLSDIGQEESRGGILKGRLAGTEASWLSELSENFQVRSYRFDRELRRVTDFASLDFRGDRSNLAYSLQQLKERFEGLPLAGILLFTDGVATDSAAINSINLSTLPPVYPVVVGDSTPLPDLSIERVELRQTAFDDAPISLKAIVSSASLPAQNVSVSVTPLEIRDALPAVNDESDLPQPQSFRTQASGSNHTLVFDWRPIRTGIQFYRLSTSNLNLGEEATEANNERIAMVDGGQKAFQILYVTGRPNWEYKFLNRALYKDPQLQMTGLIRVARREPKFEFKGRSGESSNPLYRGFGRDEEETEDYDQPVLIRVNARNENELSDGFPKTAEELFEYDALIIDDLEAEFFSFNQQTLIRRFVSERGGGLLALGGADALDHGGYEETPIAGTLPIYLDQTFKRASSENLSWKLTREGWVEPWTRVRPLERDERARLNTMPPFRVLNTIPKIKPGARVLAEVENLLGDRYPSLVAHNFGAGKVACVAIGDMWRWGMRGESEQEDLARLWRQIARWLVTDVPEIVEIEAKESSEGIVLNVEARNDDYKPLEIGQARITIQRVDLTEEELTTYKSFTEVDFFAEPIADSPGRFTTTFASRDEGAYIASVEVLGPEGEVIGMAETGWVNEPLANEYRALSPDRYLLQRIATQTGGEVLDWNALATIGDKLSKQQTPITEIWSYPLWHNGWLFAASLCCFLAEWGLRRKKGLA